MLWGNDYEHEFTLNIHIQTRVAQHFTPQQQNTQNIGRVKKYHKQPNYLYSSFISSNNHQNFENINLKTCIAIFLIELMYI